MKTIHKIAAIVVKDDAFLVVRKKGKDIWTSLGGKPEGDETERAALLREIKEELSCDAEIGEKLGDFEAKAVFDDAIVHLSVYMVQLVGEIHLSDPELEEFRFIPRNYKELGVKLPESLEEHVIPACIKKGILQW